jgi:hypothetical protein
VLKVGACSSRPPTTQAKPSRPAPGPPASIGPLPLRPSWRPRRRPAPRWVGRRQTGRTGGRRTHGGAVSRRAGKPPRTYGPGRKASHAPDNRALAGARKYSREVQQRQQPNPTRPDLIKPSDLVPHPTEPPRAKFGTKRSSVRIRPPRPGQGSSFIERMAPVASVQRFRAAVVISCSRPAS